MQKFDFKVGMKITSSLKIFKFPDFSRILDKMLKFPDFFAHVSNSPISPGFPGCVATLINIVN